MLLSEPQNLAVNSEENRILAIASAGSGKTRVLIERIKRLIATGIHPSKIIAITFTNAAAIEIQKRLGDIKLGYAGTIHGLMLRLLQEFGTLIGFQQFQRITVLDQDGEEELLKSVIEDNFYKGSKEDLIEAIKANAAVAFPTKAESAAKQYHLLLLRGNMLTFDTILQYGLRLLNKSDKLQVDGTSINRILEQRYSHLFVDEIQDCTHEDFAIYEMLPVQYRFFVGDPDQSIYSFRGGCIHYINELAVSPNVQTIKLEDNYRCAQAICETAQKLIENNDRIQKRTLSARDSVGTISVACYTDFKAEVKAIYRDIETNDLNPNECAVLIKDNENVKRFAESLEALGLPIQSKKYQKLPKDWKLCRLYLTLLNNPRNDLIAELYLKNTIGKEETKKVCLRAGTQWTSINAVSLNLPLTIDIGEVPELIARANLSAESIARVNDRIKPEINTIGKLILALTEEEKHDEEIGNGLTVTTIHSAKGREWKTVYLPAFEENILPSNAAKMDIEEERRVAFVAFTRAIDTLRISYCEQRIPAFQFKPQRAFPSRFISESGLTFIAEKVI